METIEALGRDFSVGSVTAEGFSISYHEAGYGEPLTRAHRAGGPQLGRGLDQLTRAFRIIALELPGFGESEINTGTGDAAEMAGTLAAFIPEVIDEVAQILSPRRPRRCSAAFNLRPKPVPWRQMTPPDPARDADHGG